MDKRELISKLKALQSTLGIVTQAALAETVGTSQQNISVWLDPESESVPSTESLILLGKAAPLQDAVWFWEQAGLSDSAMTALFLKLRKEARSSVRRLWLQEIASGEYAGQWGLFEDDELTGLVDVS